METNKRIDTEKKQSMKRGNTSRKQVWAQMQRPQKPHGIWRKRTLS